MQNAKDTGGDPKSVLVAQIGNTALESPALQGLSGTIDALKDPNRSAQSLINSQAGSVVPTLVSDIAQLSDRAQNGQGVARETNNTLDAITNRIPGIRQTNPISVDTLGRERSTGKNAFQTTLDPLRTKSLNQTPVTNEISRLVSLGGKTGFTKQDKKISAFGQDINLTPEELNSLTKSSGSQINQRITSLINSPLYSSLDDASKSKAISNAISEIRSNAKKNAVVSGANLVNDLLAATDKTRSGDVTVTRPLTSSVKSTKPSTDELNMAKYIVSQGDQDQMKVGNTYVYRNENGDVLTKTEDQIQREVTNANITIGLEQAKRNKDYTTWEKLQAQQFNDLQKLNQTLDPVLDAAKIIQNQNKQQDIITQVQKYRSYGGSFKKPAKVRKPKSSPVSLKATRLKITQPKIKKVSVKKLSLKVKKYKVRKPKTYKA
jgi:hypothetical protein